jgi:hypothetical protein
VLPLPNEKQEDDEDVYDSVEYEYDSAEKISLHVDRSVGIVLGKGVYVL